MLKGVKGLKRKVLISLAALSISGIVPLTAALAQGELKAELVAEQGGTISGKPGETILVPVNIYVTPFGTGETSAVTVTAKFDDSNSKTVPFGIKEFNVKKRVDLEYTIPMNASGTVSPRVVMTSTDTSGNDKVVDDTPDTVTIHVIPADTTAPTLTLPNPIDGFFNKDSLPTTFTFTLDEAAEVFMNQGSIGPFEAGTHQVSLPTSIEGENKVSLTATDAARNTSAKVEFTYFYDTIKPVVEAKADREPNAFGWYNADVIVSFEAKDSGSGVASTDSPLPVIDEGKDQLKTGKATDKAGNIGTGSISISIDKTKPEISLESGGVYKLNEIVTWTASDNLSGFATPVGGTIDTSSPGKKTVTLTATDKAGNTLEKPISYTVVYNFGEVLQPINKKGDSVFKAGSTVPVKFQLTDFNEAYVSSAIAKIHFAKSSTQVLGTETEATSTSAASTGNQFRYDPTSNQYIFNLSTKGFTIGTYLITIQLDDGKSYSVQISLK